jgi:hypothetical protein
MWKIQSATAFAGLALATLVLALAAIPTFARAQATPPRTLVFLTRDGCVNTATMRARLDEALDRIGAAKDYAVIDADTLSDSDARRGYGTPTVLYNKGDLFGMPESTPPLPSPT